MSKEENLLAYWRELSEADQDRVLEFMQSLQANHSAPSEPLIVRSQRQLEELLLQGVNSLDQGAGVEATDDWWEQKRQNLLARRNQNTEK